MQGKKNGTSGRFLPFVLPLHLPTLSVFRSGAGFGYCHVTFNRYRTRLRRSLFKVDWEDRACPPVNQGHSQRPCLRRTSLPPLKTTCDSSEVGRSRFRAWTMLAPCRARGPAERAPPSPSSFLRTSDATQKHKRSSPFVRTFRRSRLVYHRLRRLQRLSLLPP